MFEIRRTIIEDPIPWIKFACDTKVCKGACCTMAGGKGAPLLNEEIGQIELSFQVVKEYLPEEHLKSIEMSGLFEGNADSYTTTCYNNRACVFVMYENGIAKCSIEKAYQEGRLKWKKPISCHLFPIRIDNYAIKSLRYERIRECSCALQRGENEMLFLSGFLKEPLIRNFGSSWYEEFNSACEREREDLIRYRTSSGSGQ